MPHIRNVQFAGFAGRFGNMSHVGTPLVLPADSQVADYGACAGTDKASAPGVGVVVDGGPFWIGSAADDPATASTLLSAYLERGVAVLDELQGRFGLAIVDSREQRVVLALDPMGIQQLAYAVRGEGIVFASNVETVRRSPAVAAVIRQQAIFDFLLLHMVPAPDTIYQGVHKLRPGTMVTWEKGRTAVRRFWNPVVVDHTSEAFPTLANDLRGALREGVMGCGPTDHTGAFLSGGLDSSSLVGTYAGIAPHQVHAFSMAFDIADFNEIEYARIACRHFGAAGHEYQVTPEDMVEAFPVVAAAFDEPFGNSSAIPTYVCAKFAAANGFTQLLAGDGGDEIFAGNERYTKQAPFELYRRLPIGVRRAVVEPLAHLFSPNSSIALLRKARSFVDQARIPLPERLYYWSYLNRSDRAAMFCDDYLASIDTRAAFNAMAEVYSQSPGSSTLARMLYFDWQYTLSDNDLRKVSTMCALAGVTVDYPMLHPAVLNLSLRVPSDLMMPRNQLRHFYKESMRGFLPDAIIDKSKHGFGLPFGQWLKVHRPFAELIDSLLADLKRRMLVRSGFIDELVEQQRSGHASYYGYAIWDLAMLEAWFQAHGH
jgi:asparagine synthase (glutamine-hydrolysing)